MNILFICSGTKGNLPGWVVKSQADTLMQKGICLEYFLVKEKGFCGYFKSVRMLKQRIKNGSFQMLHAHGLSSLVATLTLEKPIIVSIMGSEVFGNYFLRFVFIFLANFYWNHTIVKSKSLKKKISLFNSSCISVIPNGVNTNKFFPREKSECRKIIGISLTKTIILFLADPERRAKNYPLALEAVKILKADVDNVELINQHNIDNELVPIYLNSADIVLLTSLWEGSPNIVKEAMACNRPVVATDVGDIKELFGSTHGCFLTSFDPKDIAIKIEMAMLFSENGTNGRERILELGLDSFTVSNRLISMYEKYQE